MDAGNFVADVRLDDSDEVLQLPIVKNKLKKLLQSAVRKMALLGAPVIPSSDDPLDQFLQSAGKFFGKDPTRWEQMGEPKVEMHEEGQKRYIKSTGVFSGTELHLFIEEPYHDERLPVREDRPELNFSEKRTAINTDDEWHAVIADQPWTASKRRQMLAAYLHAQLEADDGELAAEGCHSFWELSINKENHADIRMDRLASLLSKLNSSNLQVATTAAAAVWGLAITGGMRRNMSDLDVMPTLINNLKKTLKMQTFPDSSDGGELGEGMVSESVRARLQRNLLGALAVLLVDRCCRRPYLQLEQDFSTLFALAKAAPGYRPEDEQIRRETAAKVLTSLVQRDGDARKQLVSSGSLRQVLTLLNPQGPGASMIQFCMASLLATMVLDDDAMELIRERGEAPILFEACIVLLTSTLDKLHAELDRRTSPGYYEEGDVPEYDLYLGVRLAEASSQAMWGSAHYCVQMSPVQVKMEHVVELGKMGRDCVATDQLPLSRVCHCVTATMATLSSHPTTAELIMTCPNDIALSTLLLLVEVFETEIFERAGHVKASACAGIAFLACHPIGAEGDECMHGPYRTKLLEMGAFGALLRAALTSVLDPECDMIVQQAAAIGVMYLSTMAGALDPAELAMYAALLMDSDNSEMIEFLMAGMWILLRNPDNRKVLGSSFNLNPASGMAKNMMHKLNDAITLHEIHDQAQEKAALVRKEIEAQQEAEAAARQAKEAALAAGVDPEAVLDGDLGLLSPHSASPAPALRTSWETGHGAPSPSAAGPSTSGGGAPAGGDAGGPRGTSPGAEGGGDLSHRSSTRSTGPRMSKQGSTGPSAEASAANLEALGESAEGDMAGAGGDLGDGFGQGGEGSDPGAMTPLDGADGAGGGREDVLLSPGGGSEAGGSTAGAGGSMFPRAGSMQQDPNSNSNGGGPVSEFGGSNGGVSARGRGGSMALLGANQPAQGLGAMALQGGQRSDGESLPRGGGEEGGLPSGLPHATQSLKKQASQAAKGKFKELDGRFNKQLKDNWGLETLVSVGESWLPAMLEQDEIGEATDIPVLKLFEFLVASICLFMIEDDMPSEPRELDLFVLSAPRLARTAHGPGSMRTWWTVDARAPEPPPVVEGQLERALAILTQIVGMRLLAAWKSLQLGVLTLWNACARNANMERHVVERGVCVRLLSIINTPAWPPSLRDIAAGCLEFFMERFSNLPCMPPTPLPEGLTWPGKSGQPSPGLVPSILAYIQLVNTRLPLLEYRGCHGIARVCYAAPYGATPEAGREYLKEAKAASALLGAIDAVIALLKRVNRRYQDIIAGQGVISAAAKRARERAAAAASGPATMGTVEAPEEDAAIFERDMTTIEAQQDIYFVAFATLLNISVLKSAQPLVARKGLHVLLGTSTLLYSRVANVTKHTVVSVNEDKLLHLVSAVLQNLALHPANRTRLYKAELEGAVALDKVIEQATGQDEELKATASLLPPLTAHRSQRNLHPGSPATALASPRQSTSPRDGGLPSPARGHGGSTGNKKTAANRATRVSPNGQVLNASVDTALASHVRPKVLFPPIVEVKEDVWAGQRPEGANGGGQANLNRRSTMKQLASANNRDVNMEDPSLSAQGSGWGSDAQNANDSKNRFLSWVDNTFAGVDHEMGPGNPFSGSKDDAGKRTYRKALWDVNGEWLEEEPESAKALSKLLCRPLHHLWNDSPEARARHGQRRWEPAISEYREAPPDKELTRPAQRLLSTLPPKDEQSLMSAATQMLTQGRFDPLAVTQHVSDFSSARPPTRSRENGRVALTVLQPHPEVVLAAQAAEDALHEAAAAALAAGGTVDIEELRASLQSRALADGPPQKPVPLKVVLGPQRPRQVISFEDRILVNDDLSRPSLTMFEHVEGSRVCRDLFPSYQLPNGRKAYMYYNGGVLIDEVAVDAVVPPPRPSTVPQALQQTMPLADVLNLIAKPPGSAPPFIPYKPVPYLVPLPSKHTLAVKRPDLLTASAFGDLREDNLQLIIQAKKIIKTQTTMRVEAVEVKPVEEREPWTLPSSIFKPRVKESDARNFFDTPVSLEKMFERDWARACGKEKFASMMGREHKANMKNTKDDKGMMQEVHDVLLEKYQAWYSAFLYYAALGASDPYHMSLNAYTTFLDECQIADPESQFIKRSDCDTIFIVCNFQPDKKSAEAQVNLENAMMRYEFLESIVRAGIAKYGKGQATDDVAEAVKMILEKNIVANLPPAGRHVQNDFRTDRLYTEEVDLLLKRHQVLLKAIYSRYRLKPSGGGLRSKMLRLEGWLQLLSDAHLVDGQFTLQDGTLAFLWSRMFVVDEIKDYQRYTSLTFIDFLEALGRVADMKSLPLDADLDAAGYHNILDWALDKERSEGNEQQKGGNAGGGEGGEGGAPSGQDIFRPRESAGFDKPKTRPLYVKLEMLLDLMFRRLYMDPTNPEAPFNYDGLLKLIKKIDKDLGP